jgi:GNAT superfamily N-acetyltransferase
MACLPDSLVSEFGLQYARKFYRYIEGSDKEILLVERNADSKIIAVCVLSLDPKSLNKRLMVETSLLWYAFLKVHRTLFLALHSLMRLSFFHPSIDTLDIPELILIYASDEMRGKGIGSSLVHKIEARLRELGINAYQVKTLADPANRALAFYEKLGFSQSYVVSKRGKRWQVFTKTLP